MAISRQQIGQAQELLPHTEVKVTQAATGDEIKDLQILQDLIKHAGAVTRSWISNHEAGPCTPEKLHVRREWGALSPEERLAYIRAVECLISLPAKSPSDWAPGAKTRNDDWAATHLDQVWKIHGTSIFLPWHRRFLWEYETALREDCGYNGTHPYWNWALTALSGFDESPIFDGSATSIGSNGEYVHREGFIVLKFGNRLRKPGSGGGCIRCGPFANKTVNLGPAMHDIPGNRTVANPNGPLAYNPRCLQRDFNDENSKKYLNATAVVDAILHPKTIYDFNQYAMGRPTGDSMSVHIEAHQAIGGEQYDLAGSPQDPVFLLHHAMVDLIWWVWQALDWEARTFGWNANDVPKNFGNESQGRASFEDVLNLQWAGERRNRTVREMMSVVEGPLCYVYE